MTRIWLVNWHFQSRITLWCRHKSTNVSMGLCWQIPKFIVWRLWSIYFDHLPLKLSIRKRRKQSCTSNIVIQVRSFSFHACTRKNTSGSQCVTFFSTWVLFPLLEFRRMLSLYTSYHGCFSFRRNSYKSTQFKDTRT